MPLLNRLLVAASIALPLAFAAAPAEAGTILETATASGTNNGVYILSSNNLIGAAFTLDQTTDITAIGAEFQGISGTVFGAIVSLDAIDSVPAGSSQDLASIALGHVVFSAPSGFGDVLASLNLTLGAGTYGVVFGSGQFGADGYVGLGDSNTVIAGTFPMFQSIFSTGWDNIQDSGVRILVEGDASAVPEPASWATMSLGMGGIGGAMRLRRRRARIAIA